MNNNICWICFIKLKKTFGISFFFYSSDVYNLLENNIDKFDALLKQQPDGMPCSTRYDHSCDFTKWCGASVSLLMIICRVRNDPELSNSRSNSDHIDGFKMETILMLNQFWTSGVCVPITQCCDATTKVCRCSNTILCVSQHQITLSLHDVVLWEHNVLRLCCDSVSE